jgi:MoxR-like ATPase
VRVEASRSAVPLEANQAAEIVDRIVENVKRVIHAPEETLRLSVLALLAEGHVILEDAPGPSTSGSRVPSSRPTCCRPT